MLGSILISLLVLAGPGPAFRSDRLETMADALGRARVEALPDGESLLSWSGATVSVVKCGGTVEHIGYALFSQEQRELIGPTVGHFVERYSLEADLPLQREKTRGISTRGTQVIALSTCADAATNGRQLIMATMLV